MKSGEFRRNFDIFAQKRRISTNLGKIGRVPTNRDIFEQNQTHFDEFQRIPIILGRMRRNSTKLDTSGRILTTFGKIRRFRRIWTQLSEFRRVRTILGSFRPISTDSIETRRISTRVGKTGQIAMGNDSPRSFVPFDSLLSVPLFSSLAPPLLPPPPPRANTGVRVCEGAVCRFCRSFVESETSLAVFFLDKSHI